jgi:diguanylate cyclase (GGDEF)-like protein
MLLAVVSIDTLRNIVENIYFGLYFDAQYGFLPHALVDALGMPILLIVPKLLNIASGCLVMSILLLRWLPEAVRERDLLEREADVQRSLAMIDGMTGLFNRRHFLLAAEVERQRFQRHRRPLSLLMVDIDLFKSINDRFGHDVGDEVITRIAAALQRDARGTDVVARLGGEEFGLLLPDTPLEGAEILAERFRAAVSKIIVVRAAGMVSPTISIGVSEAAHGMSVLELMKEADIALYDAKQTGRNRTSSFERTPNRKMG